MLFAWSRSSFSFASASLVPMIGMTLGNIDNCSGNPDTGGLGLGLAVARSIARDHGGDLTLAARNGGGLSARLELPS